MAIDRFSTGPIQADVQSEFIPLPLDLINRQLEQRQQTYDVVKTALGTTKDTLYGIKGLSQDQEVVKSILGQYEQDIAKTIEGSRGDYSQLTAYADSLGEKVKRDIQSGQLGAIQNNYIQAMSHKEDLDKRYKEGKISKEGYNLGLSSISAFEGTKEIEDGYSRFSGYDPVNYVDVGKRADDYGTEIADQYDKEGRKYINGDKATSLIEKNLWNDTEVREFAKEQVLATLTPEERNDPMAYSQKVSAYIRTIAKNAGYKLQYHQVFKPEGDNTTDKGGGKILGYNMVGAQPLNGMINLEGTGFNELMEEAESAKFPQKVKKVAGQILGAISNPYLVPALDIKARTMTYEADKKMKTTADKVVKDLAKQDMIQDIAAIYGIDLAKEDYETMQKLQSVMQQINTNAANSPVTLDLSEKTANTFESFVNSGVLNRYRVHDVQRGIELTPKEIEEMNKQHLLPKNKTEATGKLIFSGEINSPGQAYPAGTIVFTYNSPEGDLKQYALDLGQNVRSMEFLQDRVIAAKNQGASFYKPDKNTTLQFIKMPDGSVASYINGVAAKDENGNKIYYR
jgi:hypothetical protein